MTANVVYQVAKELSPAELESLSAMLQNDISKRYSKSILKDRKTKTFTDQEAVSYLFENIF